MSRARHTPPTGVLVDLGADIEWPDEDAADLQRRQAPVDGSWGTFADHATWLAGITGSAPPPALRRARIVRFGTSDADPPSGAEIFAGVRDLAPVTDGFADAVRLGVTVADEEIDSGTDLLGVCLAGRTTASAALIAVVTNTEPIKVMPRGVVPAPPEWMAQAVAVRDLRRAGFGLRGDPDALLDAILVAEPETADIVALTGFLLRCSARRTPVLLDGLAVLAAACVAHQVQARAARFWRVADTSGHPAHALAVARLGQQPILDHGSSLADGAAAALAGAAVSLAVNLSGGPVSGM